MDALDLANTLVAQRGRVVDTLDPALGLHELRDTIRTLFDAAAAGREPPRDGVELVNGLAVAPRLTWDASGPRLDAADVAGEIARSAIELLASGRIASCRNPRCVQYFLAEGRRAYCSQACANRTRVARHAAAHPRQPMPGA